jgi:ABC-type transporter MlaC component
LRNKYLPQLQAKYRGETILEMRQALITPAEAVISAKVLHRNLSIPIDIRMRKGPETWKVYDLSILGVSAVGNYRAQFDAVLRKRSPAQAIELLKSRLQPNSSGDPPA